MRNTSYLVVAISAAAAVAGCGGSSVGGNRSTSGSAQLSSNLSANLKSIGYIETSYLTGNGRATDYVQVLLNQADYTDNQGNYVAGQLAADVGLTVGNYGGPVVLRTSIPFGPSTDPNQPSTNPNSRLFTNYSLSLAGIIGSSSGVMTTVTPDRIFMGSGDIYADTTTSGDVISEPWTDSNGAQQGGITNQTLPSPFNFRGYIRAFPGRVSTINVRFDQNTFGVNFGPVPFGLFELSAFKLANPQPEPNVYFLGALSDYMSFDISAMPASEQPLTYPNSGVNATRIFFSGDGYATADATTGGTFHELTPYIGSPGLSHIDGTYSLNASLNTGSSTYSAPGNISTTLPGTYTLTQPDPSDPTFIHQIVSQQGMFRDYTQLLSGVPTNLAVTFPSTQDNSVQDIVVVHSAVVSGVTKVKDMYYGYIDMEAQQVFLYPIADLPTASTTGEIDGTITANSLVNSAGAATADAQSVRTGSFTLNTPLTFSDGTTYSGGSFVVFRK